MRSLAVVLSFALLLPLPTAAASHQGAPTIEHVATSSGLNLSISHEGGATATGTGQWSGRHSRGTDAYDFVYSFAWNATAQLRAPPVPSATSPDLEGMADISFLETGKLHQSWHSEGLYDGKVVSVEDKEGTCTLLDDAPRQVPVRAVFLPERGSLLVLVHSLQARGSTPWVCKAQTGSGQPLGESAYTPRLATDGFAPDALALRAIINRSTAARLGLGLGDWGSSVDADVEWLQQVAVAELPLALAPTVQTRQRTLEVPVDEPYLDSGRYCLEPEVNDLKATCTWSSTVHWQLDIDACPEVRRSLEAHMDLLRSYPKPDASRGLPALLAWRDGLGSRARDVLTDARSLALLGCPGDDGSASAIELIAARTLEYQRALLEIHNKGDRTPDLVREIVTSERQLQLFGFEGDLAAAGVIDGAAIAPPAGQVKVSVHSPVSIHAWTQEGAHVGWNKSADAPEIEVEGARYEGRPGEAQTITLPAGVYRVTADELSPGAYTLNVSWDAEGATGSEIFALDAREGRSFVTHYALVAADAGAAIERYPVARLSTPVGFAFLDAPLRPVPAIADIGTLTTAEDAPTPAPTPVTPVLLLLAIAAGALLTSRRRG